MSQNDHTGLESYTNDELVSEAYRVFDDLLHPQLLMELAKRLEVEGDASIKLEAFERSELSAEMAREYADTIIDTHDVTVDLLKVLKDHDIESSETLRLILEAVSQIQKAA